MCVRNPRTWARDGDKHHEDELRDDPLHAVLKNAYSLFRLFNGWAPKSNQSQQHAPRTGAGGDDAGRQDVGSEGRGNGCGAAEEAGAAAALLHRIAAAHQARPLLRCGWSGSEKAIGLDLMRVRGTVWGSKLDLAYSLGGIRYFPVDRATFLSLKALPARCLSVCLSVYPSLSLSLS